MRRSFRVALLFLGPVSSMACGGSYARTGGSPYPMAASRTSMSAHASMPAVAPTDVAPIGTGEPTAQGGTEPYTDYGVNPVTDASRDHLSTFAIDVDTASYSISRRFLREGSAPPPQAVRAEEFLNSFAYDYAAPKEGAFTVHMDGAPSPFEQGHHLVRVALQGKQVTAAERKAVHLVYLVDTSGSMQGADRIELAKKSLRMLTDTLKPGDTVALCTYAGSVRLVLEPTGVDKRTKIFAAIEDLTASGSTAMASGIELAYKLASQTAVAGQVNRVVVLSDGDANVGNTSHEDILKTIAQYKDRGITLSTVGFGSGNYQDTMMEQLADKGDGNYSYIDDESQARRVFGEQVDGLLQVIARDVKVQVDFDPKEVKEYRLIGYENRDVADKDFRNDRVDGGEVGAGHSVTAMYDVVFQPNRQGSPITVRVRAKPPTGSEKAAESAFVMGPAAIAASFDAAPESFRFAAAVTGFAELLRKSPHAKTYGFADVAKIADASTGNRAERKELAELVRRAAQLSGGDKALAK